jgi:hypothetical protein
MLEDIRTLEHRHARVLEKQDELADEITLLVHGST